jgi:hypothetical protein
VDEPRAADGISFDNDVEGRPPFGYQDKWEWDRAIIGINNATRKADGRAATISSFLGEADFASHSDHRQRHNHCTI